MMPLATLTEPILTAVHGLPALGAFDVLELVKRGMHHAGYPLLFGLLLSCGVGVPLPEDIPLLLAGFFVAKGEMSLLPAAVCAWCGIIGGDCILYAIGRRFGMGITALPVIGSHIKVEQIGRLHVQFEKYGWWVVAVGRLFAGVRGAMVLVAGTIRFTFSHFIIADGLAAIFSGGLFMALGYYAGRKFGDLKKIHQAIGEYSMWILVGVIVVGAVVVAVVYWRKKRRAGQPVTEVAPAEADEVSAASDSHPG
jgi:membrane protein DedA with SNARE-associated domain